jgi:hypothetical protein
LPTLTVPAGNAVGKGKSSRRAGPRCEGQPRRARVRGRVVTRCKGVGGRASRRLHLAGRPGYTINNYEFGDYIVACKRAGEGRAGTDGEFTYGELRTKVPAFRGEK